MSNSNRRNFIKKTLYAGAVIMSGGILFSRKDMNSLSGLFSPTPANSAKNYKSGIPEGKEALYYTVAQRNRISCELCYHNCTINPGRRGFCRNRENYEGKLYNVVYGRPSSVQTDPIEKEPQHHMLPGITILCLGTAGCNFRCRHCHNWHLSQRTIEEISQYQNISPQGIVNSAKSRNVPAISFTYNEPVSFYEYALDIAKIAKKENIKILWHSNGYIKPEPLKELLQYTDAVTIDLKGFSQKAYDNSAARFEPVLYTLKTIKESGVWLEIVNLVIPTINDSQQEIEGMCKWIRDELSPEVPLHFSRFFPSYKLTNLSPTPVSTLKKAHDIARETGLHYITLGNVPGHEYNSTFCPQCGKKIIHRIHFNVMENNISNGKCPSCEHEIPGIWE